MVTTAFLLFTVSTLAAHTNAVPTRELTHDPCEGNTLCFEKPADYPLEEEMNHIVADADLRHFYRVKREIQAEIINSIDDKNCIQRIEPPAREYEATDIEGITRDIVQAKAFKQLLPEIKCKNTRPTESCFEQFNKRFGCQPVIAQVTITMLLKGDKKATDMTNEIKTGCRCALIED